MMTKLKEQVTKLVDFELDMANKEHGERFNNGFPCVILSGRR